MDARSMVYIYCTGLDRAQCHGGLLSVYQAGMGDTVTASRLSHCKFASVNPSVYGVWRLPAHAIIERRP